MLTAGVSVPNVGRYAGHSKPNFTWSRYVHRRAEQGADEAGRMDAFLAAAEGG